MQSDEEVHAHGLCRKHIHTGGAEVTTRGYHSCSTTLANLSSRAFEQFFDQTLNRIFIRENVGLYGMWLVILYETVGLYCSSDKLMMMMMKQMGSLDE